MKKTTIFLTLLLSASSFFGCDAQQHTPRSSHKSGTMTLARRGHGGYRGYHRGGGYRHGGYRRGYGGGIGFGFGLGYPYYSGYHSYPYYSGYYSYPYYQRPVVIEREVRTQQDTTWEISNTTEYPIEIIAGKKKITITPDGKQIIRQTDDGRLTINSPHDNKNYRTKKPYIVVSDFDDDQELDIDAYYNDPEIVSDTN